MLLQLLGFRRSASIITREYSLAGGVSQLLQCYQGNSVGCRPTRKEIRIDDPLARWVGDLRLSSRSALVL
jgi:hypothetical protein